VDERYSKPKESVDEYIQLAKDINGGDLIGKKKLLGLL